MADLCPLTTRYKMLQKADELRKPDDERLSLCDMELDRIYRQIVSLPIRSLADAIDKLAFADHCLTEEHDVKEAANLIREVTAALLKLSRPGQSGLRDEAARG
jgi:hypothetical protein